MTLLKTPITEQLGIDVPIFCGAMYPCSNPELVAAASETGAMGILQPLSLVYVHGHTAECTAHPDYKKAILDAREQDVVLTERLTGVPVSVIRTPYIDKLGTKAGPIGRWMLKGRKTKHWMRMIYSLQSLWKLKRSSARSFSYKDYLQAGKSVEGIEEILPVAEVVRRFRMAGAAPSAYPDGLAHEAPAGKTQ